MGVVFALITSIALGLLAVVVLYQMVTNFQPGKKKTQKDLRQMKAEMQPWYNDLVPWEKGELELLSLNQIHKRSKKRIVARSKGIFVSIYHEPMIAYSLKKYVGPGVNALLYARTAQHEFVYRIKKKGVEIAIDEQKIGTLKPDGAFFSSRKNKLLARVNRDSEALLLPVIIKDKEVANIVNPKKTSKTNPRAFEFVSDMEKEEETFFLSLAILELVQREL